MTDAICMVLANQYSQFPDSDTDITKQLFGNTVIMAWKKHLLRAPADIRDACTRFLTHPCLEPYFNYKTHENGTFMVYLSGNGLCSNILFFLYFAVIELSYIETFFC